jgi:DNA-repair protein complementing XP-A cells
MELTVEQKERIEENRLRAIALREKRKAELLLASAQLCIFHEKCKSEGVDESIRDVFNERICSVCKLNNPDYELVTRSVANSFYLVTDDALSTLAFQTRDNPHHANWTPMKLYLRKHIIALSMKRFGTMEKLEEVKKERELQKFEKSLGKSSDTLAASTKELWNRLDEDPTVIAVEELAENDSGSKKRTEKPHKDGPKKKKTALSGLVSIIQGRPG